MIAGSMQIRVWRFPSKGNTEGSKPENWERKNSSDIKL